MWKCGCQLKLTKGSEEGSKSGQNSKKGVSKNPKKAPVVLPWIFSSPPLSGLVQRNGWDKKVTQKPKSVYPIIYCLDIPPIWLYPPPQMAVLTPFWLYPPPKPHFWPKTPFLTQNPVFGIFGYPPPNDVYPRISQSQAEQGNSQSQTIDSPHQTSHPPHFMSSPPIAWYDITAHMMTRTLTCHVPSWHTPMLIEFLNVIA